MLIAKEISLTLISHGIAHRLYSFADKGRHYATIIIFSGPYFNSHLLRFYLFTDYAFVHYAVFFATSNSLNHLLLTLLTTGVRILNQIE